MYGGRGTIQEKIADSKAEIIEEEFGKENSPWIIPKELSSAKEKRQKRQLLESAIRLAHSS